LVAPLIMPDPPGLQEIRANLLLVGVISLVVAVKIASSGIRSEQPPDNVQPFPFEGTIDGLAKLIVMAGFVLCSVLALVAGVSNVINLIFGGSKPAHWIVFAILVLFVWVFNMARKKLK
jgi:hypothetical protein